MNPSRFIGLYPAQWRERYGTEFSAHLEELPMSPSVVLDVVVAAIGARRSYVRRRFTGADGNALLALIVMVPSIVVVLAFALKFKVGVAGLFDAMSGPAQGIAIVHYCLVFAPWLSLALSRSRTASRSVGQIVHACPTGCGLRDGTRKLAPCPTGHAESGVSYGPTSRADTSAPFSSRRKAAPLRRVTIQHGCSSSAEPRMVVQTNSALMTGSAGVLPRAIAADSLIGGYEGPLLQPRVASS
jgi:hypothetical protein